MYELPPIEGSELGLLTHNDEHSLDDATSRARANGMVKATARERNVIVIAVIHGRIIPSNNVRKPWDQLEMQTLATRL